MKWKVPYINFGRQFKKQEKLDEDLMQKDIERLNQSNEVI